MRGLFLLVLVLSVLPVLQGCGPGPTDPPPVVGPIDTTPANISEAAYGAANRAGDANQLGYVTTDVALANVSDFSSLGTVPVPSIRNSLTIPTLPSVPPSFPSGNPYLATSTVLGSSPNTATIDWYVYVTPTDLNSSRVEWKTTVVKSTTTLFTSYWTLETPISIGHNYESRRDHEPRNSLRATSMVPVEIYQTRGFTGSGWNNTNSLIIYTVGTGTFWDFGKVTASGTQVANIVIGGVPTQTAYSFDVTRDYWGAVKGSMEFANGSTITFSRSSPTASAIGTTATYTVTTGTVNSTVPVAATLSFSTAIYGNNTMTVTVTNSAVTTTLNYSADGSGSGSVSGVTGRSISLTWDLTGAATATITLDGQTKMVSTTVVPRPVDEAPSSN